MPRRLRRQRNSLLRMEVNGRKKILVGIIAVILVLALFGCGGGDSAPEENESEPAETVEMETEESEPADTAEEASDTDSGLLSPEFKKTMDDYEAWFDHYCEVMKKYQEDSGLNFGF